MGFPGADDQYTFESAHRPCRLVKDSVWAMLDCVSLKMEFTSSCFWTPDGRLCLSLCDIPGTSSSNGPFLSLDNLRHITRHTASLPLRRSSHRETAPPFIDF